LITVLYSTDGLILSKDSLLLLFIIMISSDHYLAYDSHHPQSVKRGIVKCLYDRAKRLVTKPSVIAGEKKHPSSVLVSNGYPSSFVQKITKARTTLRREPVAEFKSTAVIFTLCPRSFGVSPPLPRTTRHSHRL